MHSKGDDIEIMSNDVADEVLKYIFDSLKNRYQNNLESIKGSEFASVIFICCIFHIWLWSIIYRFSWLDKKQKINNKPRQ